MKKLINSSFEEFYKINEYVANSSPMRTHYESTNPAEKLIWRKKLETMKMIFTKVKYQTVLDVGCGDGGLLETVKPTANYTGVDISPTQLASFKKYLSKYPNQHQGTVKLVCHDATKLPFKNKSFDLIIACDVLEHVLDPKLVIQEIDRLLKPEGYALIGIPNETLWEVVRVMIGRWPPRSPDHIFSIQSSDITDYSESLRVLSEYRLPFSIISLITLVLVKKDTNRKL